MIEKLNRIYTLGLSETLGIYDAFKLQIVNRLAVLCIGVAAILISINVAFLNYVGIVIDIGAVVFVGMPVLILNKYKRYAAAVFLFLFGYHLALVAGTYHSIIEGRQSGLEYLFIPGVISIIILVSGFRQYISVCINFALFMILNYIRFEYNHEGELATYFRLSLILFTAYLMVYYFVVSFKTQLFQALKSAEKLNAELVGKEEALLDSNKSKDRLFSIIAHDLRSPLALIQGLLQPTILQSMSKEEYLRHAQNMSKKVGIMQNTMNGLLDWAKSQLGNLIVNPELVSVQEEIDGIIELLSDSIKAKSINLVFDIHEVYFYADKNQFIIIARNIIHNAIKFTPVGGTVKIKCDTSENKVCISVEDSGTGMSEEIKERIIGGQLIESTFGTAGESGSGIGLSFCQELLRKNQGRLSIKNANPTGIIFQIWLPKGD